MGECGRALVGLGRLAVGGFLCSCGDSCVRNGTPVFVRELVCSDHINFINMCIICTKVSVDPNTCLTLPSR